MITMFPKDFEELNVLCIGGDSERQSYYPAIIGLAKGTSYRIAYSREKLISCYMKLNDWTWEEAEEWIEYNVERALPYYGEKAPVILNNNFISSRNKTYIPIKIIDK